jgi:GntR family transcriptional regulator
MPAPGRLARLRSIPIQYFRLHDASGQLVRSETVTLECQVAAATKTERNRLSLPAGGRHTVVRLVRRRKIGGRVVMWETMVLPAARVPDFPRGDPPERLYVYLLEAQGIRVSAVRESLSAELADAADREHLRLRQAAAVLRIEEVAYDQNGTAVIWAVHRAVTDKFSYINEIR